MTNAGEWQGKVGDNWAAEWKRTDRSFGTLNTNLVGRAAHFAPGSKNILDVGCGAGATSIAIAEALPDAQVLGIDLSAALIEQAKGRTVNAPRCSFAVADASLWQEDTFRPDLFISRHGVMFFGDPVGAFTSLAHAAAPDARLTFSCFRQREANEWAMEIADLLPVSPPADPHAPGPFAFADVARVESILERAGWKDAAAEPFDFRYIAGAGSNPVADAVDFFTRIGPAAPVIRGLDEDSRGIFLEKLQRLANRHLDGDTVNFASSAWIWTAKR